MTQRRKPKPASPAKSVGVGASRGSQRPHARGASRSIGENAANPQELSLDSPARAREAPTSDAELLARVERELPAGSSTDDIILFIARLQDEDAWVRGVTAHVLDGAIAGARGDPLSASTIEQYSVQANRMRKALANSEEMRGLVLVKTLSQLALAEKQQTRIESTIDAMTSGGIVGVGEAKDLKAIAEAGNQAAEAVERIVDRLTKLTGLVQSGTKIDLAIDIGDARLDLTKRDIQRYFVNSIAFVLSELGEDGVERYKRFLESDVPALPGGGSNG